MDLVAISIVTIAIILFIAIPGFLLSMAIFPRKEDLDPVERVGLSVILGLTPFFLLYFGDRNFSIPITDYTTLATFLLVSLAGYVGWRYRIKK
ncbi:MAG: hypothetical protein DRO89_01995 [Candidatus Altiarchaeales archaeon]|nr:MAG: hypothetical protein DRO89_01995 [Candidatus Altiarchaeales archaeon]